MIRLATLLFAVWSSLFGGRPHAASEPPIPFSQSIFKVDNSCSWDTLEGDALRKTPHLIGGPAAGENRAAWLRGVREYRDVLRNGRGSLYARMNFDGVRSWIRLAEPVGQALALKQGDVLHVAFDARWVAGNNQLCGAFDLLDSSSGAKVNWSQMRGAVLVPKDGRYHRVTMDVTVPAASQPNAMVAPIFGMDGTYNAAPGKLDIKGIDLRIDDAPRMEAARRQIASLIAPTPGLDRSIYDRPDLTWASRIFTCQFAFMYDRAFYDPEKGYAVDAFLDDSQAAFGGCDAVLIWQAYPRIGVDARNQFDFYRDMPGGLEGVRGTVRRFHERGVKVFIAYNPWDQGTDRPGKSDDEALAEMVTTLEADGIFLDTMLAAGPDLRRTIDQARPGVAFAPEVFPPLDQLSVCSASWAQGMADPYEPGMLLLKWIEPRHMEHQIRRWNLDHGLEIQAAFFNGSGMLVWENVFGCYNPWRAADRALWRRAVTILRPFAANFTSDGWDPFYPTRRGGLFAHRWPGGGATLFTLRNTGAPAKDELLLEIRRQDGDPTGAVVFFDLWNGKPARWEHAGDHFKVYGSLDQIGCIVMASPQDERFQAVIRKQQENMQRESVPDRRNFANSVADPKPVQRTAPARQDKPPAGMAAVPGGRVHMNLTHPRRECGCHPAPGTVASRWRDFLWGDPATGTMTHHYEAVVKPYFIDETEVSNAQFKRFLDATGYKPTHAMSFLKQWPGGVMPAELADHPVVYVDLEDARAYARWAGKRLPTEPEWQLAAQGSDGRKWPWGNQADPARCNGSGGRTMPVRSLPDGRSPFGCYHMAGNVWEWTESERDDGHTRFAIIRGGSCFKAEGSIWYVEGGAQPCTSHTKFLLEWPGLDRCATVGFRCVKDVVETRAGIK
jgi:formylglycine-generating enzyme required for sulfatase activity